jgi:hypothetical protein
MKKIRYINKVITAENYNKPVYENLDVETQFVKRYYNAFAILAGLNTCSRDLLDFLTEDMDEDNLVRSDIITRNKFLTTLKEQTIQTDGSFIEYSDSNIKKSYQTLLDRNCLIKVGRGAYQVNPEIFFKRGERSRLESVKISLEFRKGVRNDKMELIYELND